MDGVARTIRAGGEPMPKAILKNGLIHPLEPLPTDWAEGQELVVEAVPVDHAERADRWYRELEEAVAEIDPEDERRRHEALEALHREAKERARREMELP
jgi:hypothetical protein